MTPRIASLRFYDYPVVSRSMDALWTELAASFRRLGIDPVPDRLCRDGHPNDALRSPALLFGQTCGYPLTYELKDHVRLVATPEYDTPDNDGPNYRSLILAPKRSGARDLAAFEGARVAINSKRSFSGFIALKAAFAPFRSARPFFASALETGDHLGSLVALSNGDADVCACDCVSYHLLARHQPELTEGLSIIGYGPWAPGLPFVSHIDVPDHLVADLQQGVVATLDSPASADARSHLLLRSASLLKPTDYQPIVDLVEDLDRLKADDLFPIEATCVRTDAGCSN